jgi:creatinine amidohydrolase
LCYVNGSSFNGEALMRAILLAAVLVAVTAVEAPAQHSRRLNDLNWMEVEELVPMRVTTVMLPVGTLEAHGVGPNGADNLVPEALAAYLADELDGLIAPTIPYGVNTSLDEYAGTFGVEADLLEDLAKQVLTGLARTGFRNIIVLNGHGPNFEPLNAAALAVFRETDARVLVVNWWTATAAVTEEVFGQQGGHAGVNENAALMVVAPETVHSDRYRPEQAKAFNSGAWRAYPFPATIGLYAPGEGYPDFDREKAERYFERVKEEVLGLVRDVIARWEAGGR